MPISSSKYLLKIVSCDPSIRVSDIDLIKNEFNTTYQKIYQLLLMGVSFVDLEYIFNVNRELEFPPSIKSLAKLYNAVEKDIYAFLETTDILIEYRAMIEDILLTDESIESESTIDYTEKFKESTRICNKLIQLLGMNYSSPSLLKKYLDNRHNYYDEFLSDDDDLSLIPSSIDYGYDEDDNQ